MDWNPIYLLFQVLYKYVTILGVAVSSHVQHHFIYFEAQCFVIEEIVQ